MMQLTNTVKHLIIINVIFFIATRIPSLHDVLYARLSLFYPENPNFGIWQLISHMFMHGNWMHLLFNMIALASFGSALEYLWGRNKFLIFYILTGLGAAFLYLAVHYFEFNSIINSITDLGFTRDSLLQQIQAGTFNDSKLLAAVPENKLQQLFSIYFGSAVGASGALYGILVAFAIKYPDAQLGLMFIPVPIRAKYFVPGLVLIDLFLGLNGQSIFGSFGTGIAHFAHVGGALTGYLLMLYFNKSQFKRWD